jgi:apolipoprotein N-acyltransferase
MPASAWRAFLRPYPGTEIPVALRLLIAAATGAGLALSYTGFYLAVYSWVCVGLLMIVLFGASPRVAFACGFLHGLAFVLASVPWIASVLAVHGGLSEMGGWTILLLIAAAWGILTGGFAWCVHRLSRRSIVYACCGAPFLWVTFEFVRAHLPEISFPWNLLGYPASNNSGLVQLTTITGIYGLSFLIAAFNALLAWADAAPKPRVGLRVAIFGAGTVLIVVAMIGGSRLVPKAEATHYARAVQTNFPEADSYPPDWFKVNAESLEDIEQLSLAPAARKPDLIVWPEAPAPFSWQDPQFAKLASSLAEHAGHPFLAGVIEWKNETLPNGHTGVVPYNSAILVDAQGQRVFSYDKIHLVPFGEYEPFPLIHRVVTSVSSEVGGFQKGKTYSIGTLPGGFKFGVFICYEAIYPGEVRRFAAGGADLLINISNDGWFGKSAAAEQHLRMARVRAVENRRWLLRVTNSGITASVDPYGRIFAPMPRDVRGAVDLPYDFKRNETIYTRFGDWFAWLCVLVSGILVVSTFLKGNFAPQEALVAGGMAPVNKPSLAGNYGSSTI